ncbi:hypothetical protein MJD09_09985 [bacterium]|nr:hypothetical protein [bacterium]
MGLPRCLQLPLLLCLALFASACSAGPDDDEGLDESGRLVWDRQTRTFRLHVPDAYDADTPAPLIIAFHGSRDSGSNFQSGTGFDEAADEHGFITVYPDNIGDNWAEGCNCTAADSLGIDDVGFTMALIDTLEARFAIDTRRIYAMGFSQGALFVQRLACEEAGTFSAIAGVAATLSKPLSEACTPPAPLSMLIMHGTEDPVFPWTGLNQGLLSVLGADEAIDFWIEKNGCPGQVNTTTENIRPGLRLLQKRYRACAQGTEVYLYAIEGGGHTWPQGDIDANDLVATFFAEH